MQKMLTQLEYKAEDKVYHFVCAPDSPLKQVQEALFSFLKYVIAVEESIKGQQAKQAAEKIEEIKPEVA